MVTTVGSTTDSTAAAAAMKKATGMNKDDFLRLFVTQLQNQDPLNPQDSSQFIAQLAQLTQVEQAYNTNSNLQSIISQINSSAALSAVSFIGKEVVAPGSVVNVENGTPTSIGYNLASAAQTLTISITDATGATIKTLTQGQTAAGTGTIAWDGTDSHGQKVADGNYNFTVTGTDASGVTFAGTPLVRGRVDGLEMGDTGPVLNVGSLQVPLTSVTSIRGGA